MCPVHLKYCVSGRMSYTVFTVPSYYFGKTKLMLGEFPARHKGKVLKARQFWRILGFDKIFYKYVTRSHQCLKVGEPQITILQYLCYFYTWDHFFRLHKWEGSALQDLFLIQIHMSVSIFDFRFCPITMSV